MNKNSSFTKAAISARVWGLTFALLIGAPLLTGQSLAQATNTLDTQGTDQIFGVSGTTVGDWSSTLLQIKTNVQLTGPSGTLTVPTLKSSSISNSGALTANTATATTSVTSPIYYHSSDARLKTDIHSISNPLDKLLAIQGVEFNWKKDGHADMGVVAQNVAKVFPNVVTKDNNGMMAVEYDSLVAPMIEAIRTLKNDNDELRQKVAAIDDMKAQMTQIRQSLQVLKQENARLQSVKLDGKDDTTIIRNSSTLTP